MTYDLPSHGLLTSFTVPDLNSPCGGGLRPNQKVDDGPYSDLPLWRPAWLVSTKARRGLS